MFSNRLLRANALRALAMDAVQQAKSGHPGMPMGMADIAEVLWHDHLVHHPLSPHWPNRDRFVLSNGHGSMLLYGLLHLSGYAVTLDDLKAFRQLNSRTPGHPEYGFLPGVETTTGPLGQGLANAVGMALSERKLGAEFNTPELTLIDHFTYVFAGDGCLMEGISHEACSLAGTQGLGKLIVFWDDNGISIDGDLTGWFSDDTQARFKAYGWQVLAAIDGHDPQAIDKAILEAKADLTKPTLIPCKTVIGFGAPKLAGTAKCHGAPLGEEELKAAKEQLGWSQAAFEIPDTIKEDWSRVARGNKHYQQWEIILSNYEESYPAKAEEFVRRMKGNLPEAYFNLRQSIIKNALSETKKLATRKAQQICLNQLAPVLPELLGGSADLSESNNTLWEGSTVITKENPAGNYLHYGVREFAMCAMMNGMALYGGVIPYGGTFLVFSDYARNAIRMAALMHQRVIFVLTHDSIGLGEDGPTHQPVEHLAMLRATPNVNVWRPADLTETSIAWMSALENTQGPSCFALSRQGLPQLKHTESSVEDVAKGAYVLFEPPTNPDAIVIATGSEVAIALQAAENLTEQGTPTRVVSMPCMEVFNAQSAAYCESVLPDKITARVAVEAGASLSWWRYVGRTGEVIGLDRFGESAPGADAMRALGFTPEAIERAVARQLEVKTDFSPV